MDWLKRRLAEGSTYNGLAAIVLGAGMLGKVNEARAIADGIAAAGPAFANGDYIGGALLLLGGLGVLLKDKGGK